MTKHERFLRELRAPFLKLPKSYSAGVTGIKPAAPPGGRERKARTAASRWDQEDSMAAELETRFNAIFDMPDEDE